MSSPPSCRILTISSSVTQANQLACKIIAASDYKSATKEQPLELQAHDDGKKHLLWTISNKYYTAPVHFSFLQTTQITAQDARDVPACIFVFNPSESFKDAFITMLGHLEESDFEVSIAVSVPSAIPDKLDDFENFFGEHGFEYVNDSPGSELTREQDVDDVQVPGIRRVIDALSTILWPSMVQKSRKHGKTRSIVSIPGPPGEEDGLRSLLDAQADKDPTEGETAMQHEMAALERWLEEGADDEKDPWTNVNHPQAHSPTLGAKESRPSESGFEDNFSDFVSASDLPQAHLGAESDPAFPSQEEVASMSQRLREMGMSDNIDDEGDSQASFDLSRVLAGLDAMKEEIAAITDKDEKRKAAAKVALALVYGLEEG